MNLESQVCSLDLSKRLAELGVNKQSYWYWVKPIIDVDDRRQDIHELDEYFLISNQAKPNVYLDIGWDDKLKIESYGCGCCGFRLEIAEIYPAYTSAELLELIPANDPNSGKRISFGIEFPELGKDLNKYYAVSDLADYPHDNDFYDDNFANCLAMLVIHLTENKLTDISEK